MTIAGREARGFLFDDDNDDGGLCIVGEEGKAAEVGVGIVPVEVVYSDRVRDGGRVLSSPGCLLPDLLLCKATGPAGEGKGGMAVIKGFRGMGMIGGGCLRNLNLEANFEVAVCRAPCGFGYGRGGTGGGGGKKCKGRAFGATGYGKVRARTTGRGSLEYKSEGRGAMG